MPSIEKSAYKCYEMVVKFYGLVYKVNVDDPIASRKPVYACATNPNLSLFIIIVYIWKVFSPCKNFFSNFLI